MIKWIIAKIVKLISWILFIVVILVMGFILPPTFHLLTGYIKSYLSARGLIWIYDLVIMSLFMYLFPYKIYRWYKNKKNH